MKCDCLDCECNVTGFCENNGPSRVDENAQCMDYFPRLETILEEDTTNE